ncbi:hypothetical protein C8C85_1717 [Flavobacterium sp. 103]|nr:hypothetical protein C8C85_1717 [Flavobacterium sp. 103]QKJ61952.1 hypothetical protein HQN62_02015 [Flavobacterium sp. M31R6]
MTIHHHIHLHFISLFAITAFLCAIVIIKKSRNKKVPKLLTKEKYNSTMTGKMEEITPAEVIIFNIWPYVDKLKSIKILSKKIKEQELIYKIYHNSTGEFEHILLSTEKDNNFVVIVVDRSKKKIMGYFLLDLNGEYNLVA